MWPLNAHSTHRESFIKLIAIISFLLLLYPVIAESDAPSKNILIIYSYHQGNEWTDGVRKGIMDTLKDQKGLEIHEEYMDVIRHKDTEAYLDAIETLYSIKYKKDKTHPDVIIVVDDNAFDFLIKTRAGLFDNIPVVFCGVNDFNKDKIRGLKGITGINEKKSMRETVECGIGLSENTKKIGVISGDRLSEKKNLEEFKKDVRGLKKKLDIVYFDGLELKDIIEQLKGFGKDDMVIYLSYLKSPKGILYTHEEVLRAITGATAAKVFGVTDIQIKYGVIGGKVPYSYAQGEGAAKMALRILNGEKADSIPIIMDSPNRFIFDGEALQAHKIPISALPQGSIIINKTSDQLLADWENIKKQRIFSYDFFQGHGTIMLIIDPKTGTILDANNSARMFYGYPGLVGKKIQEINTLTEDEVKKEMSRAREQKKNFFNFRHRLSNGDIRDVEVYSYPINLGNTALLFSIVFDVTDKLKAEQLRKERNRTIFISLAFLICMLLILIGGTFFYIARMRRYEKELLERNKKLEEATNQIKTLSGIIPICMHCKKIRDDKGYWNQLEQFISEHSEAMFSHSLCPDCLDKYYKDIIKK